MLLIVVIGVANGGAGRAQIGVVSAGSGALGQDLVNRFENMQSISVVSVADSATLQTEVSRGDLTGGVVIPSGYDSMIRAGQKVTISYIGRPNTSGAQFGETVRSVIAQQSEVVGAARFALAQGAAPNFDVGLGTASQIAARAPGISVVETQAGTASLFATVTAFEVGAWTELLLFVFLLAIVWGSIGLIETRRLGIAQRMLATPTAPRTVIIGTMLGRLSVAVVQAVILIVGSALLFGVHWGDPLGVAAVVVLFALASVGAGLLLGTIFRNQQQASGITLLIGLGFAALGGCMAPLEIFPPTMRQIAHITPHAWANDAFAQLVGHGASILQILPQLGVLAAYAVVLLALASWRFRKVLTA
jgi:ABC-2 type transport system permease protein